MRTFIEEHLTYNEETCRAVCKASGKTKVEEDDIYDKCNGNITFLIDSLMAETSKVVRNPIMDARTPRTPKPSEHTFERAVPSPKTAKPPENVDEDEEVTVIENPLSTEDDDVRLDVSPESELAPEPASYVLIDTSSKRNGSPGGATGVRAMASMFDKQEQGQNAASAATMETRAQGSAKKPAAQATTTTQPATAKTAEPAAQPKQCVLRIRPPDPSPVRYYFLLFP